MAKFADIEEFLKKEGINFKVINLPATAISVEDVIRLSGGQVKEDEVIKTLIVKIKSRGFTACLLRGDDRLDFAKIPADRLATKEEVGQIAGVEVGAVCPVLIGIPILIDKKVMGLKRVNMGSGDHFKGLEMELKDLLKALSDYTIDKISLRKGY